MSGPVGVVVLDSANSGTTWRMLDGALVMGGSAEAARPGPNHRLAAATTVARAIAMLVARVFNRRVVCMGRKLTRATRTCSRNHAPCRTAQGRSCAEGPPADVTGSAV